MPRLAERVAIVTGAASGAGRATAIRLAAEGARVALGDINFEGAEQVTNEIAATGGEAIAVHVDVSEEEGVASMVAATLKRFGRLDILDNNAADVSAPTFGRDGDLVDLDVAIWDRSMAVNLRSVFLGCKHAIPAMLRTSGGSIINISSIGALQGKAREAAYGTAKAGILALTRYVATMYGSRGIRCNAVIPGLILSPARAAAMSEEQAAVAQAERLIQRCGTPEDVAALVAFLASEEAGYITGEAILVDGGLSAHRPVHALNAWRQMAD